MATTKRTTKRTAKKGAAGRKTKKATKQKAKKPSTGRTASKRAAGGTKRAAKRKVGPATPTTARRPRRAKEDMEIGEPERLDLTADEHGSDELGTQAKPKRASRRAKKST